MDGGRTGGGEPAAGAVCKPCLRPFVHQVGGHVGVLLWNADTVCKPHSASEVLFYESAPDEYRQFMPDYKGTAEVCFDERLDAESNERTLVARSVKFAPPAGNGGGGGGHALLTLTEHAKCKIRFRMKRSGSIELTSSRRKQRPDDTAQWLLHDAEQSADKDRGDDNAADADRTYAQHPWALQCQAACVARLRATASAASATGGTGAGPSKSHSFTLLENLVGRMALPCVLDLKMGVRQHTDNAPREKILRLTDRCRQSTSEKLGVRLVGMQVYDRSASVYRCATKYQGRKLDAAGLRRHLRLFVFGPPPAAAARDEAVDGAADGRPRAAALVRHLLKRLHLLEEVVAAADGCRFYSSSLLLLYDAAASGEQMRAAGQRHCDVRMIDFVNSFTRRADFGAKEHFGPDAGYLLGLHSLIDILQRLLAEC